MVWQCNKAALPSCRVRVITSGLTHSQYLDRLLSKVQYAVPNSKYQIGNTREHFDERARESKLELPYLLDNSHNKSMTNYVG